MSGERLPYDEATAYEPNWRDAMIGALKHASNRVTGGAVFPDQAQRGLTEDANSVIPEISEPAKARQIAQTMMGFGTGDMGPAFGGMIRARGNPELRIASAYERPNALAPYGAPLKELSSPSFSIAHEQSPIPFAQHNAPVVVVPRVGALDPINHPGTLYPRDAFVRRGKDQAADLERADLRLNQRLNPGDLRLQETLPEQVSHTTSLELAPTFRSFKDFERSSQGAGRLYDPEPVKDWGDRFQTGLQEWVAANQPGLRSKLANEEYAGASGGWGEVLRRAAAKGDAVAQDLYHSARNAPSDYAELKTHGPLAMTPEKIAGVILPSYPVNDTGRNAAMVSMLQDFYKQRGVPVKIADRTPPRSRLDHINALIEQLQQQAGPFGGR